MALIKCPECKKKVSDTVSTCPHCGYSLEVYKKELLIKKETKSDQNKKGKVLLIIAVICVCLIIAVVLRNLVAKTNIDKLSESVVILYGYDEADQKICSGSGFIYKNDSTIITNFHVIDSCHKVVAKDEAGKEYKIEGVEGYDKEKDLAILRTEKRTNLEVLESRIDKVVKGEDVIAIGSPKGLINSVTKGIVSSIRKNGGLTEIQITAPISEGSSGGALFDKSGQVVGVTYASLKEGQNINFAIPIKEVDRIKNKKTTIYTFDEIKTRDGENNAYDNYIALCLALKGEYKEYHNIKHDEHLAKWANKKMSISGFVANVHYYKDYDYTDVLIVPKKKFINDFVNYKKDAITFSHRFYDYYIEEGGEKERLHPSMIPFWEYKTFDEVYPKEDITYTRKKVYDLNEIMFKDFSNTFDNLKLDDYGLIPPVYIRYIGDCSNKVKWGEYITQYGEFDKQTDYSDLQMDILESDKYAYKSKKESYIFTTHYNGFMAEKDNMGNE